MFCVYVLIVYCGLIKACLSLMMISALCRWRQRWQTPTEGAREQRRRQRVTGGHSKRSHVRLPFAGSRDVGVCRSVSQSIRSRLTYLNNYWINPPPSTPGLRSELLLSDRYAQGVLLCHFHDAPSYGNCKSGHYGHMLRTLWCHICTSWVATLTEIWLNLIKTFSTNLHQGSSLSLCYLVLRD